MRKSNLDLYFVIRSKPIFNQVVIAFCVASAICALFFLTAPRGLSWDLGGTDSGELAAAVQLNGLVHSPGYPTYLLVAQVVKWLPFSTFSLRLVMFSAIAASITSGLLAILSWRLQSEFRPIAMLTTVVIWGMNELVWTQAVIIEVYALASVFAVLLLLLTVVVKRTSQAEYWVLWGIVLGLGFGSHYLIGFIMVFAAVWFVWHQVIGYKQIAYAALGLSLGLLVFLWLPLRAGESLLSNWGNPNTVERFWWVVSGAAYADRLQLFADPMRIVSLTLGVVQQLTPIGIVFVCLGYWGWWNRRRGWVVASLPMITLNVWVVAAYNSADTMPYLYPSIFIFALAGGEGIIVLLEHVKHNTQDQRLALHVIGYLMLVLLSGLLLLRTWPSVQQATIDAEIFGRLIVQHAEPNTIILSDEGKRSFALRYAIVEQQRLDIVSIDLSLLFYDWYRADLAQQLALEEPLQIIQENIILIDELLAQLPTDRPIITTLSTVSADVSLVPNPDRLTYSIVRRQIE